MSAFLNILQKIEVGEARVVVRIVPVVVSLVLIGLLYGFWIYHGLNDSQSMDNAQLARQIVRGQGFTTKFIRPQAVAQMGAYVAKRSGKTGGSADLFPADRYLPGVPRILPDTYNAPGYPCLLAAWFYVTRPHFDESATDMTIHHMYAPERLIPVFNQIFIVLTAALVFFLARRLFDGRVAWISMVAFAVTDMVWQFSLTALSTDFLMFLVTAFLFCALEIFCVGEACLEDEENSFGMAWVWAIAVALLLGIACLTRLQLLVLLVPLLLFLITLPRGNFLLFPLIALLVLGMVAPWFWHMYRVSGNPLGSNLSLLLYGTEGYEGNQTYCSSSIPGLGGLLKGVVEKELLGFGWHFEHAWDLLGFSPMIIFFAASFLHQFRQPRTQVFRWLLLGCALVMVAMNNLAVPNPAAVDSWNIVALLYPCFVVFGCAFFFILLDRLNLQIQLLVTLIVIATLTLAGMPLVLAINNGGTQFFSMPPYLPPYIQVIGQYAQPEEWTTSDMPWAAAWYADRASLWLPDTIADFENLHDTVSPTGVLFFTPVTWSQSVSSMTTGEYKDWLPLFNGKVPHGFPLSLHVTTPPGGPDYRIWSDRPRWEAP